MKPFQQYKANFKMPQRLQETLTEEEQETHILICFCNEQFANDHYINPEDF